MTTYGASVTLPFLWRPLLCNSGLLPQPNHLQAKELTDSEVSQCAGICSWVRELTGTAGGGDGVSYLDGHHPEYELSIRVGEVSLDLRGHADQGAVGHYGDHAHRLKGKLWGGGEVYYHNINFIVGRERERQTCMFYCVPSSDLYWSLSHLPDSYV